MNANINTNNNFLYTKQPFYILYKENKVNNSTYPSGIILSDSHISKLFTNWEISNGIIMTTNGKLIQINEEEFKYEKDFNTFPYINGTWNKVVINLFNN